MQTKVISSADINAYVAALPEVVGALREGALVVFPTETVYGIAANAANAGAMRRLREVKECADGRPFTVHLGRPAEARRYVRSAPPILRRLARKGWPGPLTLIAEEPQPELTEIARSCPPEQLRELFHAGTLGLRCPDHAAAARLLSDARVPVVATSANRTGWPPPFEFQDALRHFDGQVEYAVDGGRTRYNSASTVVEVRGHTWTVRREGAVDERTIRRWARTETLFICTGNSCRSPMAEHLFRHRLAQRLECTPEELSAAGYIVSSAGTAALPDGGASSGAIEEMARRGLDLRGHRSQPATVELVQRAERIYVMTAEHRSVVVDLVPGAAARVEMLDRDGPVADPLGGGPEEYRHTAVRIERLVEARLTEFLNEDLNW